MMLRRKPGVLLPLAILCTIAFLCAGIGTAWRMHQVEQRRAQHAAWPAAMAHQVFGFERQFLMLRAELAGLLQRGGERIDLGPLAQRYEILLSRVEMLHSASGLAALRQREEYEALRPQLLEWARLGDEMFAARQVPRQQATAMVARMDAMMVEVQSQTRAASFLTSDLVENQVQELEAQTNMMAAFAMLQLPLLAIAVYSVRTRNRQQQAAQERQRRMADELREAKLTAESAARAKSQFLANMSHELRTPFQGVLGMLQLLEKTELAPSQSELVKTAADSANHLLLLLNDILDISAIEAGRIVLHHDAVDLPRLCREVEALMRVQAEARGLNFVTRIDPDLRRWVAGDATRIKQILFNLLHNAIKFTPEGDIRLEASSRARPDGRQQVLFEVVDSGIGMDDETQARLFRRFEPGESGLSRRFSGTGLGLEISRNLARLMGGDLVATSALGVGSRFSLTLDLPECSEPRAAAAPSVSAPQRSLRVLVADDHPINRRYLALVLESLGHRPDLCENGEEAVELVQCDPYDAVLMDVHMPVLDGLTATRRIRALGSKYARLPILALTADAMASSRERALDAGVTLFVPKPVQPDQLATALAQALGTEPRIVPPPQALGPEALSQRLMQVVGSLPREQVCELLRMFFEDDSHAFAELQEAIFGADPEEVRAAAHKYKGSARMLGLNPVAEAAEQVEAWARQGAPRASAQAHSDALQAALESTRQALRSWLENLPAAT